MSELFNLTNKGTILPITQNEDSQTVFEDNCRGINIETTSSVSLSGNGSTCTPLYATVNISHLTGNTLSLKADGLYASGGTGTGGSTANTFTTAFTYSNNIFAIKDNAGSIFNASINTVTGLTVNGALSARTLNVSAATNPVTIQGLSATTADTSVLSVDINGVLHAMPISSLSGATGVNNFNVFLTGNHSNDVLQPHATIAVKDKFYVGCGNNAVDGNIVCYNDPNDLTNKTTIVPFSAHMNSFFAICYSSANDRIYTVGLVLTGTFHYNLVTINPNTNTYTSQSLTGISVGDITQFGMDTDDTYVYIGGGATQLFRVKISDLSLTTLTLTGGNIIHDVRYVRYSDGAEIIATSSSSNFPIFSVDPATFTLSSSLSTAPLWTDDMALIKNPGNTVAAGCSFWLGAELNGHCIKYQSINRVLSATTEEVTNSLPSYGLFTDGILVYNMSRISYIEVWPFNLTSAQPIVNGIQYLVGTENVFGVPNWAPNELWISNSGKMFFTNYSSAGASTDSGIYEFKLSPAPIGNPVLINSDGSIIVSGGTIFLNTGHSNTWLAAQTFSATTNPVRIQGLQAGNDTLFLTVDGSGIIHTNTGGTSVNTFTTASTYNNFTGIETFTRNDNVTYTAGTWSYVTADTITNNVFSTTKNGNSAVNTTINAATGGSYSNGVITLAGSGSLSTITGLQNILQSLSSTTLTNNLLNVALNNGSLTASTINAATGGTYSNGVITLLGSGSLSTITGIPTGGTNTFTTASTYNSFTGFETFTRNDNVTYTASGFSYLTADTITNNVFSSNKNGSTATATTINAATGGSYSNGIITLAGSGSLSTITGLQNLTQAVSSTTVANNIINVALNSGSLTASTINAATGGTFSNGVITLLGSGSLSTITGLPTGGTGTNTFTTASTYNSITGVLSHVRNDNVTYTAGTWNYVSANTLNNNILSVTSNGSAVTNSTINAATGGSYSNGVITLAGSGSLSTITGLQNIAQSLSSATLSNNVISIALNNGSVTASTINAATGGTFSNGVITLLGSGSLTTITGLPTGGTGTNTFTTASTFNAFTGILSHTRNDNVAYTAGTWNYSTGVTLNNNILSVISNGVSAVNTTINAATGGSYSNGIITLLGSGSLTTITGLPNLSTTVSSTTVANNIISVALNSGSLTASTINAATGGTYSNGVITLLGSGSLSTITGLQTANTFTTASTYNAATGVLSHTRNDNVTYTAGTWNYSSGVTLTNNILSVISNGGSLVSTTLNAATGGTYSAGVITLLGSGSLTTITGLPTGGGSSLSTKSGIVAAGTFAGSPKKATITFAANFTGTTYAITVTGEDARTWTTESKTVSGFTINSNSNTALAGNTSWMSILNGES